MALTGYEKPLKDYTKEQLIEIAESYKIYYTTASGVGKLSGYRRLTKEQLIGIIKNDSDYKRKDPKAPRRIDGKKRTNRLKDFKESLFGTESPEELMDEILSRLSGSEVKYPTAGNFYTFIYYAKTPGIRYDRHPLIKAGDMLDRGFRGFNYHWVGRGTSPIRQYNTEYGDRLVSGLYELSQPEFATLLSVPYIKIIQN